MAELGLSWVIPTTRADKSALAQNEISKYVIEYGLAGGSLTSVEVNDAATNSYLLTGLTLGETYRARISAVDTSLRSSQLSGFVYAEAVLSNGYEDSNIVSIQASAGYEDSNIVSISAATDDSLVTDGLVFHLESDAGVQTSGSDVTAWDDQVSGLDLSATGAPQYVASSTPAGKPALDFDGVDDYLSRSITGSQVLPDGAEDRTVIFVVKYNSVGFGGFAYGNAATNEAFGTIVSNTGTLRIQAWGANDADTAEVGNGAGWLIQSAIVNANAMSHYKDGTLIDSQTITYATNNQSIVLGAEIDTSPKVHMEVCAVLVYDRALSAAEHGAVVAFLDRKYLTTDPVANADSASVYTGDTVIIDVLANDNAYYSIDPTSVEITVQPNHGTVSVNATTGDITYEHTSAFTDLSDSFSYRYQDVTNSTWSNEAIVTVSVFGKIVFFNLSVDRVTGIATLQVDTDVIDGTMYLRTFDTDPGVVTAQSVIDNATDSQVVSASRVTFTIPNGGFGDTDYYAVVQQVI